LKFVDLKNKHLCCIGSETIVKKLTLFLFFILSGIVLFTAVYHSKAQNNTYYISPTGNDNRSGQSEGQAWATFERAWQDLYPGDTLILLDGTYYQKIHPNKRNGEPGNPITIRAQNDGKAIIDGQSVRIPVQLGEAWPGPIGQYYVIEGIVAKNSSDSVYKILDDNNVLRRVSGFNANTDINAHVFAIFYSNNNLIEDCLASGSGRKMAVIYKGDGNTIRRCFADWHEWDGRDWHDCWPWGDGIEIYDGNYNTIENSITYGKTPTWAISLLASSSNSQAIGNKILGTMAIMGGMDDNGSVMDWGDTRPQPTTHTCVRDFTWPSQRAGITVHDSGLLKDNLLQDIFAYGNAGLGLSFVGSHLHPNNSNNRVNRATIISNGLDNPNGPWPGTFGGKNTDALQSELDRFTSIENSYIENIFVDWPNFPNGQRNLNSMNGEGARLSTRYVDGVLTNQPLWPWPMEERIQAEIGVSVTDLVMPLVAPLPTFSVEISTSHSAIDSGDTVDVNINVTPLNGFSEAVQIEINNPAPSTLTISENTFTNLSLPNQKNLIVKDEHNSSFADPISYVIPVTITGGDIVKQENIVLIVNGEKGFLPLVTTK
jgi:hypothetical protein